MNVSADQLARQIDIALKSAGKVTPSAKLQSISMTEGRFALVENESASTVPPIVLAQHYQYMDQTVQITVQLDFQSPLPGAEPDSKLLAAFSATYGLTYKLEENVRYTAEDVDWFARVNSLYNVWSYWREFLQSATARMQLPPLTLPLLTVAEAVAMIVASPKREDGPSVGGSQTQPESTKEVHIDG